MGNKKRNPIRDSVFVIPLGLEPKTYCLEGSCSIQLSYGTPYFLSIESGCKITAFLWYFQIFYYNIKEELTLLICINTFIYSDDIVMCKSEQMMFFAEI